MHVTVVGRMLCGITMCRVAATSLACVALMSSQVSAQSRPETPDERASFQADSMRNAAEEVDRQPAEQPIGRAIEGELPEVSFEQTISAFTAVRRWVGLGGVPDLDGTPMPSAWVASVILRNNQGIIGQDTSIALTAEDATETVRRAATKAIARAVNRVQGPPDALRRTRIAEELARVRLSLEISTGMPVPVAKGISAAELDQWLRPGLEGLLLQRDGSASARTPAAMLASGLPASSVLVTLVAELAEDPSSALQPFDELSNTGYALSFFRVRHAAQLSPDTPPLVLHRGGAISPPVRTDELVGLATRMSAHIRSRAWPGVERLGLRGNLNPITGTFARGGATPFGQAFAAEALLRYAAVPGGDPIETERARVAAEVTLASLAVVEGDERAPWGDAVTASACLNALMLVDRAAVEGSAELRGLRDRCIPVVTKAYKDKGEFDPMIPAAARGVVARAIVSLARFEPWNRESHLLRAELAIRQAFRESSDSQMLSLMPDLAWADLALASETGISPPSAEAIRALRTRLLDLQLRRPDLVDVDRDLAGGFVLDTGGSPLPTWHSTRPTALLATMLGDSSLTRGTLGSGEVGSQLLKLSESLRFVKQLSADERVAHMYANPDLAIGGVRASLWDQDMSLTAAALGLIAVTESLESLNTIAVRTRPAASMP